ncbi:MAG: cellulase family glycosylhydrolase [Dysgonamonadaceae bacterium]|jgi:aryl-phospho-beta-D-glucosidase BglC (GH1 family)|nr:cellulase family glycosylhydrolase [Dysgonamonadaceae bacterium]
MKKQIFFLFLMLAAMQSALAQPSAPAPTPPHAANRVAALFSDPYTPVGNIQYNATGSVTQISVEKPFATAPTDKVIKISNLTNGTGNKEAWFSFDAQDWRTMDTLHIDIFSPADNAGIGEFDFALLSANGTRAQAGIWLNITNLGQHGQWIAIELPITRFAATANMQIDQITQIAIRRGGAGSPGNLLFVDNIYAYQSEYINHTPTIDAITIGGTGAVKRGATAQYGATVTGAHYPSQAVTWSLAGAVKPATTLSSAGLLTVAADETAAVLTLTATSVYDNTKSAVRKIILITPPATPAPTPVHAQEDVKNIFSDHYNNNGQFVTDYSDWLPTGTTLPRKEVITPFDDAPEDHVLFLDSLVNNNVAQISLGAVAMTDRDSIHIDVYSPGGNDGIGEFEFALYVGDNHWNNAALIQADVWYRITQENRHGQWISFEVPISKFLVQGEYALILRLRRGGQGSPGQKLYVDNVYIYTSQHIDHSPVVKSVGVSGATQIERGAMAQYGAVFSVANNPPREVSWSLSGAESSATTLSSTGLLTVAADETAATLTVTATSDYDNTKSGSLTVTIVDRVTMTVGDAIDLTSERPHIPAPLPRHDPTNVRGILSDVYPCGQFILDYADWLSVKAPTREIIYPFESAPAESLLKLDTLYSNNHAQISLGTCNLTGMDSLHIDIYSPGSDKGIGEFDFGLIFDWSGGNHVSANIWLNITEANLHGRWISFDIALTRFVATNPAFDVSNINIIRLRRGGKGAPGTLLYVDNIYAYKTGDGPGVQPPDPDIPPELPAPTTVPTVTANVDDVISIFCEQLEEAGYQDELGIWDISGNYTLEDDYAVAKMNYGQNANQKREFVEIVPGSGNSTIKLTGWNDYPFKIHRTSTTMDLSDMKYLHISAYLASGLVNDKPCSMTFFMHDNHNPQGKLDSDKLIASVEMKPGEWTSISIPLCYFEDMLDLSNVYVLRPRLVGYSSMNVYIDNIFAYKGEPVSGTAVATLCSDTPTPGESIQDSRTGSLPPRETVMLGINLASGSGGSNPGRYGTDYRYPKNEDLYYFNAKGIKLIRLPFRWPRVQSEFNGALTTNDITEMHKVVKEAERLGMWVMLDMHDYCERAVDGKLYEIGVAGHRNWLGNAWGGWYSDDEPVVTAAHYADVWAKLAVAFADCSNIWGYDLMNEPKSLSMDILFNNYQMAINAIREKDMQAYISIEGRSYASAAGWASVSDELKNLTDPANKLIYQAHCYFDGNASGTYQGSYDSEVGNNFDARTKGRLDPFINWCAANGKTGMIGEFGVPYNGAEGGDPRYMVLIDSVFSYLKQHQMTATYWCGGAFYDNYHLTVQPKDNYATEKSTMAIMEKYIRNYGQSTGIDELTVGAAVSAWPNPVSGTLHVQSETLLQEVRIVNLLGQTVYDARPGATQHSVDVSRYAKGSYLLQITSRNGVTTTQKLVVK